MLKRWTFVIVWCVGLLAIISFDRIYCQQETERNAWALEQFTERLERSLQGEAGRSLHAIEDLQGFMQLGEGLPEQPVFAQFVASLQKYFPNVAAMGYADEQYTVRYVYPLNQELTPIGTQLSDTSRYPHFAATLKAQQEKRITVNKAPLPAQNGTAVFTLRAPLVKGERFAGIVYASFLADKLFAAALGTTDPELAAGRGMHSIEILSEEGAVLGRYNQAAGQSPIREFIVPVADSYWLVKTGWSALPQPSLYIRGLIWGLGGSVLILLVLFLQNMFRRQEWLTQAVAEQTQELRLKNQQLELEALEHADAEQALLASERRLAALVSAIPDILLRVSREGVILDVEAKQPVDWYLPRHELVNKNIAEVLPPELLPAGVYEKFIELSSSLAVGELAAVEYQLTLAGDRKYFEARLAVSAEDELAVIIRNVTEEKENEYCERLVRQTSAKVLAEAGIEEILNFVCEQLTAVFAVSLVRVILQENGSNLISAAAGQLAVAAGSRPDCIVTGRLSALAIRTGAMQIIQQKATLSDWQRQRLDELQLTPEEIQSEIALPLKLSSSLTGAFYLISSKPQYWDKRIVTRLQQVSDQLSIAINAAKDRERRRLLTVALEAAANAIVITDREGRVEWINPAFVVLTGYTTAEALGQNLMLLSGYQDAGFCRRFWQQLTDAEEAWRGDFAQCRKDGSLYEEVMTITPVRNQDGEIANFIAIKEDITEHKLAMAALAKANEVRAQAEKLSTLGTMAAGLSHEINQPLNSIKMIASGMVYAYHNGKERPVEDMMRNIEEISHQADRINNIITHMRSFIRREENQEVTYCRINEAIEQSLKIMGSQLAAHGVTVCTELAADLPVIQAMPTALEELVVNLAANAMQAMDAANTPDKQLSIRTWSSHKLVYIQVTDNGPGIPAIHKTKVFEPFFSTKPGSDNLGLGLSIVQSIVTSCKGSISIVSGENEGAAFLLTFPGVSEEAG